MEKGLLKGIEKGLLKGREEGLQKGIEKGLRKGEKLKEKELVLRMLESGFDLDSICKVTQLSKEKIRKIQKK